MTAEKTSNNRELNFRQKTFRRAARIALDPWFLPSEQIHISNGMQRAEDLHREGYGILALITHFSRRDPIQVMDAFMKSDVFKNTPITGPIARHQTVRGLVPPVGKRIGVDMHSVVTPQTIQKELMSGKPQQLREGEGLLNYVKAATAALQNAEVVIMAPQATRKPTLEYDGESSVGGLLKIASKKNDHIGIHLMTLGIPGTQDYDKRRGFNFFHSYDVIHGPTYTLAEALEQSAQNAQKHNREVSGMDNMDRFVFDEFQKIAPFPYIAPDSK